MTQIHRRSARAIHAGVIASTLTLVAACTEPPFAHTNPLDALTPRQFSLTGVPDTVDRDNATVSIQLLADPELPAGIRVTWASSHPLLSSFDNGTFAAHPTMRPQDVTVTATIGERSVSSSFVLKQRAGSMNFDCVPFSPCADTVRSLGTILSFEVTGADVGGHPFRDIQYGVAQGTVSVRTPAMAARYLGDVAGANNGVYVNATANGQTWVVFTMDGIRDSAFVRVRQRPFRWDAVCPATMQVGETATLTATNVRDFNQNLLTIPAEGIIWGAGEPSDLGEPGDLNGRATQFPDGTITATAAGVWRANSYFPGFGVQDGCNIRIVP